MRRLLAIWLGLIVASGALLFAPASDADRASAPAVTSGSPAAHFDFYRPDAHRSAPPTAASTELAACESKSEPSEEEEVSAEGEEEDAIVLASIATLPSVTTPIIYTRNHDGLPAGTPREPELPPPRS